MFSGEIIDVRNIYYNDFLAADYKDWIFFYEGIDKSYKEKFKDKLIDRRNLKKSESLVFLSPPVNINFFREIVYYVEPEKVYIGFYEIPDLRFKDYLMRVLKVVKHITLKHNGKSILEDIAVKLGVEDAIIKATLKYLVKIGRIKYFIAEEDEVYIQIGNFPGDKRKILRKN